MDGVKVSPPFSLNLSGVKSAIRHTVLPLVASAGAAALQAGQAGAFTLDTLKTAFFTAIISGVIRLLQVFVAEHKGVS